MKTPDKDKTEASVKKDINKYLNTLHNCTHFHYSALGGAPGVADRIVCYRGQFIAIEVKRPSRRNHKNGGQSDNQRAFEKRLKASGGHYILAYEKGDVIDYFLKHL